MLPPPDQADYHHATMQQAAHTSQQAVTSNQQIDFAPQPQIAAAVVDTRHKKMRRENFHEY